MGRGALFVRRSGHPVWLCYGAFTFFFYTLWGAIVDGAGDHCVSVWTSSTSRIAYRTLSVHVEMLVEDHGVTSACTFASPPPGPTECVCICQCTHKYALALQVVFDSAQVKGLAIRLHVTRR